MVDATLTHPIPHKALHLHGDVGGGPNQRDHPHIAITSYHFKIRFAMAPRHMERGRLSICVISAKLVIVSFGIPHVLPHHQLICEMQHFMWSEERQTHELDCEPTEIRCDVYHEHCCSFCF
jgi:hypothetical protein